VHPNRNTLRIGTRGSTLARWQAGRVQGLLAQQGIASELVIIRTAGDRRSFPKPQPGETGKGLFAKEIEDALLAGEIDLAVHSLKDLASEIPQGLTLAAFPEREDPRDALVTSQRWTLKTLPRGATLGTSSLRRKAALLAARSDLKIAELRGNVPTRIARVGKDLDGAVLALAGLKRLGLASTGVPLDPETLPPAPGQGALAIEARCDDRAILALLAPLDDPAVRTSVEAERAALRELEGGCRAAIGAYCTQEGSGGELILHVKVFAPDGSRSLAAQVAVDRKDPKASGRSVARELISRGARELIREATMGG
jgi:hydroxymethylbilane synthase